MSRLEFFGNGTFEALASAIEASSSAFDALSKALDGATGFDAVSKRLEWMNFAFDALSKELENASSVFDCAEAQKDNLESSGSIHSPKQCTGSEKHD